MILSESAINEIRAALASGDGADLVRQLAEEGMQDLIEAEGTEHIGADRWECTISGVAHRTGHRSRTLSTTAGDLELKFPKLDRGSFFLSVLEQRRRIDQAMYAVVMEVYVHGV
jgi:putative transposase